MLFSLTWSVFPPSKYNVCARSIPARELSEESSPTAVDSARLWQLHGAGAPPSCQGARGREPIGAVCLVRCRGTEQKQRKGRPWGAGGGRPGHPRLSSGYCEPRPSARCSTDILPFHPHASLRAQRAHRPAQVISRQSCQVYCKCSPSQQQSCFRANQTPSFRRLQRLLKFLSVVSGSSHRAQSPWFLLSEVHPQVDSNDRSTQANTGRERIDQ